MWYIHHLNSIKAVTYTKYGPSEALYFKEVEKPVPKENEVLVKVIESCIIVLGYAFVMILLGKEKF
jgi:NADPH:quinone reductase-like Zn-dependent oxidoreductase